VHDDLYDGLKEEVEEGTNILLGRGWAPYKVLTEALVEGMRIVGEDFRDGILFVPEVLLAANAMKAGMFILRPLLAATGAPASARWSSARSRATSTTSARTSSA
jgi:methanogenic corrinoid protein MtbC1